MAKPKKYYTQIEVDEYVRKLLTDSEIALSKQAERIEKERKEMATPGGAVVYNPDETDAEAKGSGTVLIDDKKKEGDIAAPPPPPPSAGVVAPPPGAASSSATSDSGVPALF